MAAPQKHINPFYVILVVLGVVFAITACAYGVMTVKMSTAQGISESAGAGLIALMNTHGLMILLVELGLLAVATFAAMATDDYWQKRDAQEPPHDTPE
ncbi:MAG TPA: hypothetical protein VL096_15220 [Pirellulaceae bacterium]|nr:hypothetical protein [Pirellulaceae bacterium]